MHHISLGTLKAISEDMVFWMQSLEPGKLLKTILLKDYHGFAKARIPYNIVAKILAPHGITPEDVQAELVAVFTDLSQETHLHKEARAFVIILGDAEHVSMPHDAYGFVGDLGWCKVAAGQRFDVPPNTPHTFTVRPGGVLYFLSVQTPPIERGGGDDYFLIPDQPKTPAGG